MANSGKSVIPGRIVFTSSPYLFFLLFFAHLALLVVLPLLVLPFWVKSTMAAVPLFSMLYFSLRDAWLRLPSSCAGLAWNDEGCTLIRRDGVRSYCHVLDGSLVTPLLTVLNLGLNGERTTRSVIILPDSIDAESFRRLRVWLKYSDATVQYPGGTSTVEAASGKVAG